MNQAYGKIVRALLAAICVLVAPGAVSRLPAQTTNGVSTVADIRILEIQGQVQVLPQGATGWQLAQTNEALHPMDQLLVGANSRAAVRWSDQSVVAFGASTEMEVLPPGQPGDQAGLHLMRGIFSFFHRDQPGRIRIITRGAVAGVEGTEFVMAVNDTDATTLSVIDGKVRFGNDQATLLLTNGEQAVAAPGAAPARTPGFIANNLLQWCFYYPAVIDPAEVQLTGDEQNALAGSLAAYRAGDLTAALDYYPTNRTGVSTNETVYHAALLLSVGNVDAAQGLLAGVADTGRTKTLADALQQLIAAVKRQPAAAAKPGLASELLAGSYYEQSRAIRETSLKNALDVARQATVVSPSFGFAWERTAELEFGFGETKAALADLDRSLTLAPRNAQALALKGFIYSAQNQPKLAREWFDRAIAADAALGNAWLGRGLARIHLGDSKGGREDLLVAAALEPQRAELRSYLGKAFIAAGDDAHATKELALAKRLDPQDPTPWLYSALQNQSDNRVNDAIRDLEKSKALNDNRSVYRSQLLLDQDQAVRSANLAGMYQDDGMFDLSIREAGRAVSSDYANYSAHYFLANSYDQLRDPTLANYRYETTGYSEFWIANLLAPTSAGWLSDNTAEQPYNRLFDQNRVGVSSDTTYLDRGAWTERGSQFGTYDNFSYNLEAVYQSDPGQYANNDLESRDLHLTLKYQFTPQDSAFVDVEQYRESFGDVNEYYNINNANPTLRVDEYQEPNITVGYHHEWSPGVHTLFFGAYDHGYENVNVGNAALPLTYIYMDKYIGYNSMNGSIAYTESPKIYSAELQQIWEQPDHTTVLGSRYQWGRFQYQNQETSTDPIAFNYFPNFPLVAQQDLTDSFYHLSLYGYHHWQIADSLMLVAGLSYDDLYMPADGNTAPFSTRQKTINQFSPKAGIIWTPAQNTIVRAGYTRSLSGAESDQSLRIEPSEVAGFNQDFRSLISESAFGATYGAEFNTYDISLEQKFDSGTYLSLTAEQLDSSSVQSPGILLVNYDQIATNSSGYGSYNDVLKQTVDYREQSLLFTADQLLGSQWAAGLRYQLSSAKLNVDDPGVPGTKENVKSVLNQITLHANWNHPSGLFSILEANWYHQNNAGFSPAEPGNDFWQFNAYVGCRFWHRRAEFTVGLLNLSDQNYRLEPLNLYNQMAYGRTIMTRLQINF